MKVLVAYDGFEHSRFALDETAKIAREENADVTVLGVVAPDARGTKSGGHVGLAPHADVDVAFAQGYLRERGIEAESKTAHGVPAEKILEEARAGDYDLIVVGTRGLGPIGRLLLGSVSHKVTAEAPCAVIVAGEAGTERFEPHAVAR